MDASEWNDRYAAAELVWSAGPNQFVAAEVADLPPGRALDLAAGEGRNAIWLAGVGWRATAVDFSDVAIAKGRQIAEKYDDGRADRVTWQVADVLTYEADPHAYDLVVIAYLQLAAAELRLAFAAAVHALAPGGVLLVVGHDRTNLEAGYGGPPDPERLLSPEDVAADLKQLDPELQIVRAERVQRSVDTPDGPRTAIDTLVRATRVN